MSDFITTIAQIQAAGLDIDKNSKIEVLEPHLAASERNFLLPILGQALYDTIKADAALATPTAPTLALLPYLIKPVAYNGYYLFFKKPVGSLSHSGFYKKTFDHSQQPAKWEIDLLKDELICSGDKAIDELIDFLRENSEDYPDWTDSSYFTTNSKLIVQSAEQFNLFVKIGCSSRTFQQLLFFRQIAERNVIRTVCNALFARIQGEISGEIPLTPVITALLPYLRSLVTYDTMIKGIMQVPLYRYGADVVSWTYSDGTLSKSGLTMPEARELSKMYSELYQDARNELIAFLNENIEDYPEYSASDCFSTTPRTLEVRYDNKIENKHFGI